MKTRLQFSLRAIWAVVTICCAVCGYVSWQKTQEREKCRLIDDYHEAMDKYDIQRAMAITDEFVMKYPSETVGSQLKSTTTVVARLLREQESNAEDGNYGPFVPCHFEFEDAASPQRKQLVARRNAARTQRPSTLSIVLELMLRQADCWWWRTSSSR